MSAKQFKQHDITDCGPACLAFVAACYRRKISVARLRQFAGTDRQGTSMAGIIEAAEQAGFEAKGVRGNYAALSKVPLPAIVHVERDGLAHFIVVVRCKKNSVKIMDPAHGHIEWLNVAAFEEQWTGIALLLKPVNNIPLEKQVSTHARFWKIAFAHRSNILQALAGAAVYTMLGLSTAIFIQKVTDNVIRDGDAGLLMTMSIVIITLIFFQWFIGIVKSVLMLRTGQFIDGELVMSYYKHLLNLPVRFFDTMRIGEILSRVNDAVKIRMFISDIGTDLILNIFIVLFSTVLFFLLYWKLALLVLIMIPLYIIIFLTGNRLNSIIQRKLMEGSAVLESRWVEDLGAIRTIKRFGIARVAAGRMEGVFYPLLKLTYKAGMNNILISSSANLVAQLLTVVLFWWGAGYVIGNDLSAGELFSCYALLGYLTGPASGLAQAGQAIQQAKIAAGRLFEIFDLQPEHAGGTIMLEAIRGDIVFEKVCFGYAPGRMIFEGLDLTIKQGSFTAIVGQSGSGKSTIGNLLESLYPLKSGKITINGINKALIDRRSLHHLIVSVPQDIELFSDTIAANIAPGDNRPDMQKIISITDQLGITSLIEALPNGFDTRMGERGTTLSGGQRQRIAIARALYYSPHILILDEATSALDSIAAAFVQKTINNLIAQQCTVIMIAHRLISIKDADNIIVLEKGKLNSSGTHRELMKESSIYKEMWAQQFGVGCC